MRHSTRSGTSKQLFWKFLNIFGIKKQAAISQDCRLGVLSGKTQIFLVILSVSEESRGNETSLYTRHLTSFRSREIATLTLAMTIWKN